MKLLGYFFCTLIFLSHAAANARPIPGFVTSDVLEKSDTVIVGQTIRSERQSSGDAIATVRIERVIKGSSKRASGQTLRVYAKDFRGQDLRDGSFEILPLVCAENRDTCESVMGVQGGWPALRMGRTAAVESLSEVEEAVANELAAVVGASDTTLSSHSVAMQLSPNDAAIWRQNAADVLMKLPPTMVTREVQALGLPSDPAIRLAVVGMQLRVGIFSDIATIRVLMTSNDSNYDNARNFVAFGLWQYSRPTEQLLPALTEWLHAPSNTIRECAAWGLREIGTRAAMLPLLTYGVSDDSAQVRYYAVSGLAKVTGEMPYMDQATFAAHDAELSNYWKQRKADARLRDVLTSR